MGDANRVSLTELHTDVLFKSIFLYLNTCDIWNLSFTCHAMQDKCWEYFENFCTSLNLSSVVSPSGGQLNCSTSVGFGAGVTILLRANCRHLRELQITGQCCETEEKTLEKIISLLVKKEAKLKRLVLRDLNLSCVTSYVDEFSMKCSEIEELELRKVVMSETIQQFLQRLLQQSKAVSLRRLVLDSLSLALNDPLPTQFLTKLLFFSDDLESELLPVTSPSQSDEVARCCYVNSECCLEEVFRKCPHLEVVDMSEVMTVTDRTLLVLLEYCGKVHHIFIKGCTKITLQVLQYSKSRNIVFDDVLGLQDISESPLRILGQI